MSAFTVRRLASAAGLVVVAVAAYFCFWPVPAEPVAWLAPTPPGYPDNLMRGRDGRIWVGLFRPRNAAADGLSQKPFLRKVLLRLPRSALPVGDPYGHVFAFDESGQVIEDLQDPSGAYPETTGATETADRLYIHSLHAPAIAWLPRSMPDATAEDIEPFPTDAEPPGYTQASIATIRLWKQSPRRQQ